MRVVTVVTVVTVLTVMTEATVVTVVPVVTVETVVKVVTKKTFFFTTKKSHKKIYIKNCYPFFFKLKTLFPTKKNVFPRTLF